MFRNYSVTDPILLKSKPIIVNFFIVKLKLLKRKHYRTKCFVNLYRL